VVIVGVEIDVAFDLLKKKGQFGMGSSSYITNRPKARAKAKVQRLARKTKNRKTKARYKRNLDRGNTRPKMRRQTGLVRVTRRR
jgi:hypothetical protein